MSHTTTSKTMSALPLRLCRHMHASTTSGAAVQVLPMASAMGSEAELAALREQLTAAVASQDFAQAALLKPQVEALQVKLDEQAAAQVSPPRHLLALYCLYCKRAHLAHSGACEPWGTLRRASGDSTDATVGADVCREAAPPNRRRRIKEKTIY